MQSHKLPVIKAGSVIFVFMFHILGEWKEGIVIFTLQIVKNDFRLPDNSIMNRLIKNWESKKTDGKWSKQP